MDVLSTAAGTLTAILVAAAAAVPTQSATAQTSLGAETGSERAFNRRVVATGLGNPYEIIWGPDGYLWATEKSGLKVTRVDPQSGRKQTALTVPDAVYNTQAGVLGLALHPDLLQGKKRDWVYISYNYEVSTPDPVTGERRRTKIVRYTFRPDSGRLVEPRILLAGLPGSRDHQSARLRFAPAGNRLYYSIGDQGANQQSYYCDPNWAQRLPTAQEVRAKNWTAYRGKTLRLNLDGSIPADNPRLAGVRSHVWTYGHRNGQGLTFGTGGRLYQGDQGPKTDDEVNLLRKGGNYGWPNVVGYQDDQAYTYANWSASSPTPCAELTYSSLDVPPSVPQQQESDFRRPDIEPLRTFGTVGNDYDFTDETCAPSGLYFICFPTVANSSLEYYRAKEGTGVPGWRNSLLMTTLKDGTVYRLGLTADGRDVTTVSRLWRSQNRYRDTAVSPDGRSVFVATDTSGLVRGPGGVPSTELANPGSILEFRWNG
jgi:PQQ-dependent dehydrogenase (s-GDH family)